MLSKSSSACIQQNLTHGKEHSSIAVKPITPVTHEPPTDCQDSIKPVRLPLLILIYTGFNGNLSSMDGVSFKLLIEDFVNHEEKSKFECG